AKGWSAARLAEELHIRDSTVFKALALLDLPGEVRAKVSAGDIKPATAYELSQLDSPDEQAELATRVVAEKLTRDQVADVVKARREGRGVASPTARVEFKLPGGCKVTVAGLADDRPETVLARLTEAVKAARAKVRESAAEQAA